MKVIKIKDIETQEVVKTIDVTGKSDRQIERCLLGIIHQMNQDKYVAYGTNS